MSAFFIRTAPLDCNNKLRAECAERTGSRLPSMPPSHCLPLRDCSIACCSFLIAGVFRMNSALSRLPSRLLPPTIDPIFWSPAP
uniref:DNA polymerase n=1 Tax=uncultured marine virus TaxID=186617 RepID=A0A0F7L9Q1_9VIRU|nr:DNA polymerase [uncultured marine virus]